MMAYHYWLTGLIIFRKVEMMMLGGEHCGRAKTEVHVSRDKINTINNGLLLLIVRSSSFHKAIVRMQGGGCREKDTGK